MKTDLVPSKGLIFAPMEGITDSIYRQVVTELCPDWDALACDFLRVPSAGHYPKKHLIAHMGEAFLKDEALNRRTMFQILTSENAFTADLVKIVDEIGIKWVDLNLGCPSKTVCKSGGGSSLLRDLKVVERIVDDIRKNFSGRFTCKVRAGFSDASKLEDIIKLLNDGGAEIITVHGRTREMMYKEPARWEWIERAVKVSQVPIIGNGDIWSAHDAHEMIRQTGCYAVMVARGALKSPWFPSLYHHNMSETPETRILLTQKFLARYAELLSAAGTKDTGVVRQIKSVSRFMFDALPQGEALRRKVLLSQDSATMFAAINGAC
jgi:nifR3 family TIM-barrel protein